MTAIVLALSQTSLAQAQSDTNSIREPSSATVAALPVALYTAQANLQEASDTAVGALADQVLQGRLAELLGEQLVATERVRAAEASPKARETAGGQACNVIVACARLVGRSVGARWAVMAKVSKTSNLIWLFTGQLVHVGSGRILLDDSTELKGDPSAMVRAGTRIFAERIARTVQRGGLVTNFPNAATR